MENTIFLVQKRQVVHWQEIIEPIGYCTDEEKEKAQSICDDFNKRYNAYNKWLADKKKYVNSNEEFYTLHLKIMDLHQNNSDWKLIEPLRELNAEQATKLEKEWELLNPFHSDEIDREGFIYEIIPLPSL